MPRIPDTEIERLKSDLSAGEVSGPIIISGRPPGQQMKAHWLSKMRSFH